jgi:hypothetical protein
LFYRLDDYTLWSANTTNDILQVMGDFKSELLGEVSNRGKGDVADAIGMPDQTDYDNLVRIIEHYRRLRPGFLEQHIATVRAEFSAGKYGGNLAFKNEAEVNKDSHMRLALDIPEDLGRAIEKLFPSMFRSKKHLRWFCQKFPYLTVSGRPL